MATFEQEQQEHQKLREAFHALNAINPESLVRTDVLGKDLNFETGLPVFQRTLGLFRDLSECSLENFPYEALNQLYGQANDAFGVFKQIQEFSLQQHPQNPVQARDSLITQLRDRWNQYYTQITPHISYAIRRGTDFDTLEREARGTLTLIKQVANEFQTEKGKVLAEMEGALERVRQAAAEAGVAQHAIHFRTEAEYHKKQALWWLIATGVFAIVAITYALYSLGPQLNDLSAATMPRTIQLIVPRLVVISVLMFGLVWSARNFSAGRHNFVVNRHRQNALSSFETFVKGSGDPQTKDAVLLQATQSIFAPQDSGFVRSEGTHNPNSQIVEIVRGLSGAKL
ncbi:MAG: hypothetical protein MN733_34655 [Nitrososphaera sp.]|nr:hypothetical protein [Nitrososphaera sp.]